MADHFHVVAASNRKMAEARKIEQDVQRRMKVKIPKKIFMVAGEKLSAGEKVKVVGLLDKYPTLKDIYRARDKIRELYH